MTLHVLKDPRIVGLAGTGRRAADFLRTQPGRPSVRLGAHVLMDEVTMALLQNPRLSPDGDELVRAGQDVAAAHPVFAERGWLERPETYHRAPPSPEISTVSAKARGFRLDIATWDANFEPHDGEPGRDRWLAFEGHRTARAALLRSRTPGRPWLVCVHGFAMGTPLVDLGAFRVGRMRAHHKVNVAMPVMPSHGARRPAGMRTGEGFVSSNPVDTIHGIAQAVWEVRSLIAWIREQDPGAPIGLHGISLGGLVSSLVAALEPDLACVIATIPVADMSEISQRVSSPAHRRELVATGAGGPEAEAITKVISPLHLPAALPRERCFIVAGRGDRMTSAEQATWLWEHWGRPEICWYPGGHIGFFTTRKPDTFIDTAVATRLALPQRVPA